MCRFARDQPQAILKTNRNEHGNPDALDKERLKSALSAANFLDSTNLLWHYGGLF
jgi:hypothetical protein